MTLPKKCVCIGAGPAGLTAAYLLSAQKIPVTVVEADPVYLGGISKTVSYKGFLCDIGGHRFFSKSQEVMSLWNEILDEGFIERPRKSRIYYQRKFFDYPLKPGNALFNLGFTEAIRCLLSYLKAVLFPVKNPTNFEDWVSNQFGRRLFSIFFKSYTEKVWGMKCSTISADWAAQRIKGLSLWTIIRNAVLMDKQTCGEKVIKTLIDSFHYPRKGPGMMWESAGRKIKQRGGEIKMGQRLVRLRHNQSGWDITTQAADGVETHCLADCVISSAPLKELVQCLTPAPDAEVVKAANNLHYRDFLIVGIITQDRGIFDDNWIYIHDPQVKVGRIQNFKSWSPSMVPECDKNCYGMEYFCFEKDGIWIRSDAELIELASSELVELGLAEASDIKDGFVVRQKKAYPVYDDNYADNVHAIRSALEERYPSLYLVGRNGMHKYNNQDHAMMTAMLTVENILAGKRRYDVWKVNQDAEYIEEQTQTSGDGRAVPRNI